MYAMLYSTTSEIRQMEKVKGGEQNPSASEEGYESGQKELTDFVRSKLTI
jgi:hypothetical protein